MSIGTRLSLAQKLGVSGLFLLVTIFYFWTGLTSVPLNTPPEAASGYSGLLANAFIAGKLSLLIEPNPKLLALSDPYDPAQNEPYRLHDAALFNGKYYLYFGPSPALFLFAPYRLITGRDLPEFAAIALFCSAGLLFSVLLLQLLFRHFLPDTPYWLLLASVLAVGFGNVTPFLLRRPLIYEVAISCGYAAVFASIYFYVAGALGDPPRLGRLALGSLFLGIAAGARFPMLAAGLVPCVLGLHLFFKTRDLKLQNRVLVGLALVGPASLCLFLLGLYNYLRFNSWTQFGMVYTLTGVINQNKFTLFSWSRIPLGGFYYLLAPPYFISSFPFLLLNAAFYLSPPAGFYLEPIAGIASITPLVWIFVSFPFAFRRLWRSERALLIAITALITVGICLLLLFCSLSATMRYEVDFATFLLIPAVVLWCWYHKLLTSSSMSRGVLSCVFGVLLLITISFNTALSFTGYKDLLKLTRPGTYEAIHNSFRPLESFLKQITAVLGYVDNPKLVSPLPGSTLTSSPVVFRWNRVPGADDYWIDVGTEAGHGNIYGAYTQGATSVTVDVSHFLDGRNIHVQLFSKSRRVKPLAGMGNKYEMKTGVVPTVIR